MRLVLFSGLALALPLVMLAQSAPIRFAAPAGDDYVIRDPKGKTIIPNGRFLTPLGQTFLVAPHPYGLILSRDGSIAVTANSGTNPLSVTILKDIHSPNPIIRQIPPSANTDKGILESVFMGIAISHDNQTVYAAGGQTNSIYLFDTHTGKSKGKIDCSAKTQNANYLHGYLGDMVLSDDGRWLFIVDQIGFRVAVVDVLAKKYVASCPVGRYPFGIALSRDGKAIYVANVGMYQYDQIWKKKGGEWKPTSIRKPPFGYQTEEAEKGIVNDSMLIPGLGPVHADEAFSVWTLNVANPREPRVVSKMKTGHRIGDIVEGIPAVGGSSPNSIVAAGDYVFISNGSNDNVTVLDAASNNILDHIKLVPEPGLAALRGIIPFGLAVSPDEKRVYVAEAGINAIGVIDVASRKVLGHIPTAWFPAKLKISPDGRKLIISNAKGFGSGPNGGQNFQPGPQGSYIGSLMAGAVQVLDIPEDADLPELTRKVRENNFRSVPAKDDRLQNRRNHPVPLFPGQPSSQIRHIVFISKENRTYDDIFGQNPKGRGDSTLAPFGRGVTVTNKKGTKSVPDVTVMPNHLFLADRFAISDNFYVDADVSADGHRWLANTYPNEWVEATTPANYGSNRNYRENSPAPGNLGINGAAGAIFPEDYNEAGSMWDHLHRHGKSFFNFGFGVMFEPADYPETQKYGGILHKANFPMPTPLQERTSYDYPTYNMAIPDQFRITVFEKEFNEKWGPGKDSLPAMLTVIVPNDHGSGERPEAGYPFKESYMADNDLAIGRIVEFLSHTPYWKNMLIVITEDDAQGGTDHIDAHRSVLMAISPYARKGHVSHTHTSFGSIFKTFWQILGIPYLNQYDAAASDLGDMLTDKPDFTPYRAVPVDQRIFDPQLALDPFDEKFDWKAIRESPELDDVQEMKRQVREREKKTPRPDSKRPD